MRYSVEFACPGFEGRDRALPVGIVAQDPQGVHVRAVGIDPDLVSRVCKLPRGAVTHWAQSARARVRDPVWGPDGRPLDPHDPLWLDRFAVAGMEGKFFWGPIREGAGDLDAIARQVLEEAGL